MSIEETSGAELGGVEAATSDEFVVCAELDDPPTVEHGDAVGIADRRQSVGDDDRRPSAQRRFQGRLHQRLVLVVEVARRLVEDHHVGILEQQPGDGDALLLAARQSISPLADNGVVAVGEAGDRVVDAGRPCCGDDLGVGCVRPGVAQVLADRDVEQVGVLADHPDCLAQ